jgi:hypothetical protein
VRPKIPARYFGRVLAILSNTSGLLPRMIPFSLAEP